MLDHGVDDHHDHHDPLDDSANGDYGCGQLVLLAHAHTACAFG
jgi:hypothetical protein